MRKFEIWKRGNVYEVIFREGRGLSVLSRTKNLDDARNRMGYHIGRLARGHLLKEDPSVMRINVSKRAKLKRVI